MMQLQQLNLGEVVEKVLDDTGLAPCWLELEVKENIMLQDEGVTIVTLRRLRDLGIHIAIDDFGIGCSNIGYMKKLPVDTLKLGQSLIRAIDSDHSNQVLAGGLIRMARSLHFNVAAEGVETKKQQELLKSLKCDEVLGYLISRPLPPEGLKSFWRKRVSGYRQNIDLRMSARRHQRMAWGSREVMGEGGTNSLFWYRRLSAV